MKEILKQASWLIIVQILTKVIGFFYIIFLAKSLGVEHFGLYTVSFAYFSIISSIADFGFNRFLIREISKEKNKTNELLWNTVLLRLAFASVLFAVFSVVLYLLDRDILRVNLILMASLAVLPQVIGITFEGVFIALKNLKFSALILFISAITMSLSGWFLVVNGFGVAGAINGLIFGQLIYALCFFLLTIFKTGLHFPKVKFSIIQKTIEGSFPYGILGILGLLYFRIDSIMLSYLKGSYETGIYGASYKFLETIIFIPASFATALFPNMAQLHKNNIEELKKLYYRSFKLMLLSGLVLFLGYIIILPELIKIFLPNYFSAINSIKILAISIPFIFIATPGVQVLFSTENYLKRVMFFSVLTLLFNILLNLLFIPKFGYIAASWVTVASDVLSFVLFFVIIKFYIFKKR